MLRFGSSIILGAVVAGFVFLSPALAKAQSSPLFITKEDLQVAIRAFSFAYDMPKGDLEIEIVYNPNTPVSMNEVNQLKQAVASGSKIGDRVVRYKLVTVSEMGSTGDKVVYISHGLQQDYEAIFAKAKDKSLLTFTTDFQCVAAQKCVMGIKAAPNIKIEVSRAATIAAGLEFSQALKLMIREVE